MINPEAIESGVFSNDLNNIRTKIMVVSNSLLDEMDLHIQAKKGCDDIRGWFSILEDAIQDLQIVSKALKPYDLINAKNSNSL